MQEIAEHALTILINLTADQSILEYVATDDRFLGILLTNLAVCALVLLRPQTSPRGRFERG